MDMCDAHVQITGMPDNPHTRHRAKPVFELTVPDGDTLERKTCVTCGFVDYVNPKIVAGAVVVHEGKILLCKRAIEPRSGYWTIPAGYMELNESVEDAARREALEEACAKITLDALLAVYSIPRISQVQMLYKARLEDGHFAPGPESLDVKLFAFDEIPWPDLAFPSVNWALNHYWSVRSVATFAPFSNPVGASGNM